MLLFRICALGWLWRLVSTPNAHLCRVLLLPTANVIRGCDYCFQWLSVQSREHHLTVHGCEYHVPVQRDEHLVVVQRCEHHFTVPLCEHTITPQRYGPNYATIQNWTQVRRCGHHVPVLPAVVTMYTTPNVAHARRILPVNTCFRRAYFNWSLTGPSARSTRCLSPRTKITGRYALILGIQMGIYSCPGVERFMARKNNGIQ